MRAPRCRRHLPFAIAWDNRRVFLMTPPPERFSFFETRKEQIFHGQEFAVSR